MTVLVTGAAGYIGSHVTLSLIEAGHTVVAVDNLCNSDRTTLSSVYELTGMPIKFYECDVRDGNSLMDVVMANKVEAVVHLAGLKSVSESASMPLEYYENNVGGTLTLLRVMALCGVSRLVFSSSATVYGAAPTPTPEDAPTMSATNPYGRTKIVIEGMIQDAAAAGIIEPTILRYFNPVGSHPSGLLGENPKGEPANLMPHICKAAAGLGPLKVFGTDYDTPDGTCLRDYIHVLDLAQGHIAALSRPGTYNLGGGKPCSVLELIKAFESANGVAVPYETAERRVGDIAESLADISKAKQELGWAPQRGMAEMCRDAWRSYLRQKEGDK
jgi:UDP-glucose 4-epimerase